MAESLAVKYRPKDFESVLGQKSIIRILKRQLESNNIANAYLFAGPSGTGKTTLCRALASIINDGQGEPIEIDAASNNGVDAVRDIIQDAKQRSIDSDYKIFIIDECHAVTSQGWQAFLKCIEEPPKYTIFMFCTTNPEKIPETILNRTMRFNISKVDTNLIKNRLMYICEQEHFTNYLEACDYLSKLGNGSVRQSIAYLEKCANYDSDLSINNVLECLGNFSYDSLFDLTGAILNKDEGFILELIDNYYNAGGDLKLFVEQYLEFALDLTKYCLFKNMKLLKIPSSLEQRCSAYSNIPNILDFSNYLVEKMLEVKNAIKYDTNPKTTVEALLLVACRR